MRGLKPLSLNTARSKLYVLSSVLRLLVQNGALSWTEGKQLQADYKLASMQLRAAAAARSVQQLQLAADAEQSSIASARKQLQELYSSTTPLQLKAHWQHTPHLPPELLPHRKYCWWNLGSCCMVPTATWPQIL
jgi:hypothetical protein